MPQSRKRRQPWQTLVSEYDLSNNSVSYHLCTQSESILNVVTYKHEQPEQFRERSSQPKTISRLTVNIFTSLNQEKNATPMPKISSREWIESFMMTQTNIRPTNQKGSHPSLDKPVVSSMNVIPSILVLWYLNVL